MAINTYATLVTAVTEWLARDQDATLIARIPDFIALAEAKFNRELYVRQMETRSSTSVNLATLEPQFISLPSDFQSMRRVRLSSVTGKPRIDFVSGNHLDEYRNFIGDAIGQPLYFSIFGSEMELCPTPDIAYKLEMVYRGNIPALTASNTTNWLLTLAPDLYLYAVLNEATPYIQQDERIQVWASGYMSAMESINKLGLTATFNSGPMQVRISGATP